jgi:hypothetical protein
MADLAQNVGSPALLDWRRRIADISSTPDNRLLLASTALRLQGPPYALTAQILDDLRAGATNLPAFHLVSAEFAMRLNELDKAQLHLEALARLEPTNELHQLNLATLRLASTNATLAADGRATLERLRQSTNLGALALHSLVANCLHRGDFTTAMAWSKLLVAHPRCTSEDHLQHLDLLLPGNGHEFASYLASLKQGAITNVARVRDLSLWLIQHDRAGEAIQWLTNLPPATRAQQPVPLAIAECYLALKDWPAVENFLIDQRWVELEFMRLAFLSQAALQQRGKSAQARWQSAVREAGDHLGRLAMLLNLTQAWKRSDDEAHLLWHIFERHPGERWTLRELARLYQGEGNTAGINKVFTALAGLNPKDLPAKNNVAATSLLLNRAVEKALALAKEVHTEKPEDPVFASTYAFALHLSGRTAEGLAVLGKLKPEALEDPSVALYYGVLLSAANESQKAKMFLELAQRAPLLPEEKALLQAALRRM